MCKKYSSVTKTTVTIKTITVKEQEGDGEVSRKG